MARVFRSTSHSPRYPAIISFLVLFFCVGRRERVSISSLERVSISSLGFFCFLFFGTVAVCFLLSQQGVTNEQIRQVVVHFPSLLTLSPEARDRVGFFLGEVRI